VDPTFNVAVVIASTGRPVEIGQLLEHLAAQTYQADKIVLSVVSAEDLPDQIPTGVSTIIGSKGLPSQRNRGMQAVLEGADIIVFFDDDYLPSKNAIEGIVRLFTKHKQLVGATGRLLADGINSGGISYEHAVALIERNDAKVVQPRKETLVELEGLYGCNMAFRASAIGDTRFDEALPLYGWQEDIDFSAQLMPRGRLVKSNAFVGVHRGVKSARTSGVRLGYSQVINPIYLSRKGTMRASYAMRIICKNMLANHFRACRPEPWIDRVGRLRGNWLAISEVMAKRAHPGRILEIK
jgi:GT2 family glycosyltransferase